MPRSSCSLITWLFSSRRRASVSCRASARVVTLTCFSSVCGWKTGPRQQGVSSSLPRPGVLLAGLAALVAQVCPAQTEPDDHGPVALPDLDGQTQEAEGEEDQPATGATLSHPLHPSARR